MDDDDDDDGYLQQQIFPSLVVETMEVVVVVRYIQTRIYRDHYVYVVDVQERVLLLL